MVISVWNSFRSLFGSQLSPVTCASRRRRVAMRLGEIERVEDRVLLAGNLMVSAEYLVDAAGVPMPAGQTPAVGEAVYVRVDWQESGLTTSDHYQLGYQLNQNTSTGAPPAGFFAGTGTTTDRSFTAFVGYAISVGNVVQVTLDVGQTVAESNETVRDNVISLVFNSTEPFNPATPSLNLPQQLVTPVTGIPYQDHGPQSRSLSGFSGRKSNV
jgi:hypothetical protein